VMRSRSREIVVLWPSRSRMTSSRGETCCVLAVKVLGYHSRMGPDLQRADVEPVHGFGGIRLKVSAWPDDRVLGRFCLTARCNIVQNVCFSPSPKFHVREIPFAS